MAATPTRLYQFIGSIGTDAPVFGPVFAAYVKNMSMFASTAHVRWGTRSGVRCAMCLGPLSKSAVPARRISVDHRGRHHLFAFFSYSSFSHSSCAAMLPRLHATRAWKREENASLQISSCGDLN